MVAPDFFGFGRSDKLEEAVYTFDFHRGSLIALVERLGLENVTLVCQDWGGLLGLTLPMAMPENISRLLVMNTGLATGDVPLPEAFLEWRQWSADHPDMAIGRLMARACPHLSAEECAAYDAPFPDAAHKAGVRSFPPMVPDNPDAPGGEISRQARDWLRRDWQGRTFMAVGMQDPILGPGAMNALRKLIRGCPPPFELAQAGHFVQEWGEVVAAKALEYFERE